LLSTPHRQCDGQLIAARHITAFEIGNRPSKPLDAH
jgi:hypothetical protein